MALSTTETITSFLERILESVHPLMAESLYLAAVPSWYDQNLFAAMRDRDDGREDGLITRLARYSFISPLETGTGADPVYSVRHDERVFLQRRWIAKDPEAYRAAHGRALNYWTENPDPNPFAQAQNRLYHQLFVNVQVGMDFLIDRFRAYHSDRQLVAIDRLLDTAVEARFYLVMLDARSVNELDDLLTHLKARSAQLRGRWVESLDSLRRLRAKPDLATWLSAYVARAYGYALTQTEQYVEAIEQYDYALELFEREATTITGSANIQAERAYTMIAKGQAHVGLASSVQGYRERNPPKADSLRRLRDFFYFFLSFPLVFYLSLYLGRRVWHPRFWPTLLGLDWIIARLFATGARLYAKADPILERHGTTAEGLVADEQLAQLYLAMGDAEQAQLSFERLLYAEEAMLGEYRRASIRVGLGSALVRLGHHASARKQLEAAIPVLALYEDEALHADAQRYLAEALMGLGDSDAAIELYGKAQHAYLAQNDEIMATAVAERLEELSRDAQLDPEQRQAFTQTAAAVTRRRYPVRYRHPATIFFQRAIIGSLAAIIFLILVSMVHMDTGIAISPEISFNASPLLRSDLPDFAPILSQGVVALNLTTIPNPTLLAWLGLLLFLIYLALSIGVGLVAIVNTSLSKVQARARATVIRFDGDTVQVGQEENRRQLTLQEVVRFCSADLSFFNDLMIDDSGFNLIGQEQRIQIGGHTVWYPALRDRIAALLPESAERVDFSYSMLRSRMGALYLATLSLLLLLALLGNFLTQAATSDLPGLAYSLADLYPYLYLGLFIPPVWWFIFQPLRIRLYTEPSSRFPLWIIGVGVALTVFRVITLFRPWLTIPDVYVPLLIVFLVGGASVVIWRARDPDTAQRVYPGTTRLAMVGIVAAITVVMGLYLWREVGSYHFFVMGNSWRDRALRQEDPLERETLLKQALGAYESAVGIADTKLIPFNAGLAVNVPFGVPRTDEFTWVVALTNKAAMSSLLGDYAKAIEVYSELIGRLDNSAQVFAARAMAYQGLGTEPGEAMGTVEVARRSFDAAVADLDKAIALEPQNAQYYLWRGVTLHALGAIEEAAADYDTALSIDGDGALGPSWKAKAWTGKAWIAYSDHDYLNAVDMFQEAAIAQDSEEARIGLGYAYYSLREYDRALQTWENAAELNPADPIAFISLGTLYWRVGTLGDDYNASGTDRCTSSSLSEAEKLVSAEQLEQSVANLGRSVEIPGQAPEDLAFTYRTMAQVEFLLRYCPGYDPVEVLEKSIGFYSEAIRLDPDNAVYWHMRGRLSYAIWWNSPAGSGPTAREWLFSGLADTDQALALDPVDSGDYRPNAWRTTIESEAVSGSLSQGNQRFEAGDYDVALAYFELVAGSQPDHIEAAFLAGLAAVAAGEQEKASYWYREGIQRALADNNQAAAQEAYLALQAFAESQPGIDTGPIEALFNDSGIDLDRPLRADLAFAQGLAALEAGRLDDALEYYELGLTMAADAGEISTVAEAMLALLATANPDEILPTFHSALSRLEQAVLADESAVEDAYKLALIAAAVGEETVAARWYNEGVRRSAAYNDYPPIRTSRADLKTLWEAQGVESDELLTEMQSHLPAQLNDYPELVDDGVYWRFRAWFKYGLGMAAFRLGDEKAASVALQSAQADADQAFELDQGGNAYVQTYLTEAAWGWYHVERGDDFLAAQEIAAALADYEAATRFIIPVDNADARDEVVTAAFKAGLAALLLDDRDRAETWYEQGITLREKYGSDDSVIAVAITELKQMLEENPGLATPAEAILKELEAAQ